MIVSKPGFSSETYYYHENCKSQEVDFYLVPESVPTIKPTPSPEPTEFVLTGDVNSDGMVSIVDALLMAQYYVGDPPDEFNTDAADVNCDGKIGIVDALLIARYYVGLIEEFY